MRTAEEAANRDEKVVAGFGDEWSRFTQAALSREEREKIFTDYFSNFPWYLLDDESVGADIGCGSGRWAMVVAPRVGYLNLLDASHEALSVAKSNLRDYQNVAFHHASVGEMPFDDISLDFAYSLGVLHHVPDTLGAIKVVARKLKPGAPFLVYLYYAFDNRPRWFRVVWKISDIARGIVSRLPHWLRYLVSQAIALGIYWPLARAAKLLERLGCLPATWPLSYYRDKSLYTLRTDALDRFGTSLEQRFSKGEIRAMMEAAGFEDIRFSDREPYWCAVGIKKE
ncbi:MAG: class I SAM-dependent methyltransferase [Nitrospirota bacterium]|nr:class I SAM-dependent methyltransferase [Nitrospirota bacterium]